MFSERDKFDWYQRSSNNDIDRIKYHNQVNERDKFDWYPISSLPDMEWEQRRKCDQNTQFDGETISVWNIDGMSEHQVFETLYKMLMVAGAYESSGCLRTPEI